MSGMGDDDASIEIIPGHTVRLLVVAYALGAVVAGLLFWLSSSWVFAALAVMALPPVFVFALAIAAPAKGLFSRARPEDASSR